VDVIFDTSGSMSDKMIAQGIAEVGGILSALEYMAQVHVHPTDAVASECQKVFRPEQIRPIGGGGTDMCAGFKAVEERARREPYDQPGLIVVITDCYTPWPTEPPEWMTLIVKVGGGGTPPWACPPDHDVLEVTADEQGQ
jgi:predicted metal-dependent peptidase